jgi:hypothetical protein
MGRVGYSKEFNSIAAGKSHRMLALLEITFGIMAKLGQLAWPLALIRKLPHFGDQVEFEQLGIDMVEEREKVGHVSGIAHCYIWIADGGFTSSKAQESRTSSSHSLRI